MLNDIATSDFKEIYTPSNDLNNKTLELVEPYFNLDFYNSSLTEKIQWYKNLFYVSSEIDLGLAHCLQHNQTARIYASYKQSKSLQNLIFNKGYHETIGSDTMCKNSDDLTFEKVEGGFVLSGVIDWISNINVADYCTCQLFDNDGSKHKIVLDLSNIKHKVLKKFPDMTGMKMAQPLSLEVDNVFVSDDYYMGDYAYPNQFHYAEHLNWLSFHTNMVGITVALYKTVKEYCVKNNHVLDTSFISMENNVFVLSKLWLDKLNHVDDNDTLTFSESFFNDFVQFYVFSKRVLLSCIETSRIFGIASQLVEGKKHNILEDALLYSSHMFKIQNYKNQWGNNDNIDIEKYLFHNFNKMVNNLNIPETW